MRLLKNGLLRKMGAVMASTFIKALASTPFRPLRGWHNDVPRPASVRTEKYKLAHCLERTLTIYPLLLTILLGERIVILVSNIKVFPSHIFLILSKILEYYMLRIHSKLSSFLKCYIISSVRVPSVRIMMGAD